MAAGSGAGVPGLGNGAMEGSAPAEHPENCQLSGSWRWMGSKGWQAPYLSHDGEQRSRVTTTSWGCSLASARRLLSRRCWADAFVVDTSHW